MLGVGAAPIARAEGPIACEVTSDQDVESVNDKFIPGSFRQMLFFAMIGNCIDKKITFKVPKVVMKHALGTAIFSELKGLTIEPAADIPQVEIFVQYVPYKDGTVGCSAPSPFDHCFAYLPTSNVTIRNITVTMDPAYGGVPQRGLCLDKDDSTSKPLTNNNVLIENTAFQGFADGGVVLSPAVHGVKISKTTFQSSGEGIVVEEDAEGLLLNDTPLPPTMGGSDRAAFAVVDGKGHVTEYHLRGLSDVPPANTMVAAELFESDGKAGTKFLQTCDLHNTNLIDGKWNIDCVILPPLTLPFNYAVTVTNNEGMTSMFSVGTIPADLPKVPKVAPSEPQSPVTPPKPAITDQNPPKVQDNKPTSSNANKSPPLSLSAGSLGAGGCSLVR